MQHKASNMASVAPQYLLEGLRSRARIFLARAALLVLALPLANCASTQMASQSDFDTDYDFAPAQRFAILPIDRTTAAEKLISDMQVDRIEKALSDELRTRGYEVVTDRDAADLLVSWHLVTREKTDIRSYNAASTYTCWRCGPPVSDTSVRQFTQGTLIVDLIDPLRSRSVWRSTIQSRLSDKPDPKKAAEIRAKAARLIFAPYPPSVSE